MLEGEEKLKNQVGDKESKFSEAEKTSYLKSSWEYTKALLILTCKTLLPTPLTTLHATKLTQKHS